jgi:hypothetical protein
MPRYCLDADTFIQAKNGPYGMDIVPAFWSWLDQQFDAGVIYSSLFVYDELTDGSDDLAEWAKLRKDSGMFVPPSDMVQATFRQIADYVNADFPQPQAQAFLDGADPWVIAEAKVGNAIVVTHEILVPPNSSKVKIPNICQHFQVDCHNVYRMLRDLNARFM